MMRSGIHWTAPDDRNGADPDGRQRSCVLLLDFSYANYEQSRARVRRIGQQKRGVYIHLVCKDTIDETVMSALRKKADVSKLLVDDYKKILGGS